MCNTRTEFSAPLLSGLVCLLTAMLVFGCDDNPTADLGEGTPRCSSDEACSNTDRPWCTDGACVACRTTIDCATGLDCVAGACAGCASDADCAVEGSHCRADGFCGSCESDGDCSGGATCVVSGGVASCLILVAHGEECSNEGETLCPEGDVCFPSDSWLLAICRTPCSLDEPSCSAGESCLAFEFEGAVFGMCGVPESMESCHPLLFCVESDLCHLRGGGAGTCYERCGADRSCGRGDCTIRIAGVDVCNVDRIGQACSEDRWCDRVADCVADPGGAMFCRRRCVDQEDCDNYGAGDTTCSPVGAGFACMP